MNTIHKRAVRTGEPQLWQRLLILFAGVCLLVSLGRYFAGNFGSLMTAMLLLPAACAFAGVVLVNSDVARQPECRILLAILALVFVSCALNEKYYGVFVENTVYLGVLIASIFTCYALPCVLPKEKRMDALHALIAVCAAVVSLVCLWGLTLAALGEYHMPAFMPEYGVGLCPPDVGMGADFRLVTFTHPNTVGMVCEIVFLLSLYRVLTAKKTAVRALYAAAAVICFAAVAAASSRTSSLALCVGLAMIVFRLLFLRLRGKKNALRWGVSIAAAIAAAAVCFLLLTVLYDGLLSLSPAGRSEAAMRTDAERVVADETSAFSGRTNIWKGVFDCMLDTPRLFAIGTSPVHVGQVVAPYTPIWVQEVHSSFVQLLISCGVLCPLLFASFIVLLAIRGARLFFAAAPDGGDDGGWLVPALVAILISACMETFLLLYQQLHFANLWFFLLAGYVVAVDKTCRKGSIP